MTGKSSQNIRRTFVEFDDGDYGRIYFDKQGRKYASVTTVLGRREDSQKKYALDRWRKNNDGEDGRPYHEHIQKYAQWRGTLAHWYIQHFLDASLEAGPEEQDAIDAIELNDRNYDFVRSIALNHDEGPYASSEDDFPSKVEWLNLSNDASKEDPVLLHDILWEDLTWAAMDVTECLSVLGLVDTTFKCAEEDTLREYYDRHTHHGRIYTVENFIINEQDRYAGQFDMLYENGDGETVLLDFKTSKSVYWKYPRQLAAYARAIEEHDSYDIDRIDDIVILRVQPDRRDVAISYEDDMDSGTRYDWFDEFEELNDVVQQTTDSINLRELDDVDESWLETPEPTQSTMSEYVNEA